MAVILTIEYHSIGAPLRRIPLAALDDRIRRVSEERCDGEWREVDAEAIDYFEYADESGQSI